MRVMEFVSQEPDGSNIGTPSNVNQDVTINTEGTDLKQTDCNLPDSENNTNVIRDKIDNFPDESCKDNLRHCLTNFDESNLAKLNDIIDFLSTNPSYYSYASSINQYNIEIFVKGATFKNEDALRAIFEMASRIENEEHLTIYNNYNIVGKLNEFNSTLLHDTLYTKRNTILLNIAINVDDKEFQEKVSALYEAYKNGTCSLIIDEFFIPFHKNVNKFNIELFERASHFDKEEERIRAYYRIERISNEEERRKAEEVFNAYESKTLPEYCNNETILGLNLISSSNLINNDSLIDLTNLESLEGIHDGTLCYNNEDKLFIKIRNDLKKLNISKTDFDELFPNNSLLTFSQRKIGNCYFLSGLNALLLKPEGREIVLNCLSIKGNDLIVTFPNSNPITIKNFKKILNNENSNERVNGSLGWRALEKAYSIYRAQFHYKREKKDNILKGGNSLEVFHCFGFYDSEILNNKKQDLITHNDHILSDDTLYEKLRLYIETNNSSSICLNTILIDESNLKESRRKKSNGEELTVFEQKMLLDHVNLRKAGLVNNHAYTLIRIEGDNLYISNPHNTAGYLVINKEQFNACFGSVTCCNLKAEQINFQKNKSFWQNIYDSVFNYESHNKVFSSRWLQTKVSKIADMRIREEALNLIRKLRGAELIEICNAFIFTEQSPHDLLSNREILKYIDKINIRNINLFKIASTIQDDETKNIAYKIACKVGNDEQTGAISLFNYLAESPSEVLKNEEIFNYLSKINKYNVNHLLKTINTGDKDIKELLCIVASRINCEEKIDLTLKLLQTIQENKDIFLENKQLANYITNINAINISLFIEALNINDDGVKNILCKIASVVETEENASDARELFESIKGGNGFLLKDERFVSKTINKIRNFDLDILTDLNNIDDPSVRNKNYDQIESYYDLYKKLEDDVRDAQKALNKVKNLKQVENW